MSLKASLASLENMGLVLRCKMKNVYRIKYLKDKKRIQYHRWVMEIFLMRKLNKDEVVHHINGIKNDNRIENLIVMNDSEHKRLHLYTNKPNNFGEEPGENCKFAKLNNEQVLRARYLRKKYNYSYNKLALKFNISKSGMRSILKRISWKHI